jgi:molecular chaperone DnaJ
MEILPPHKTLGVSEDASDEDIKRAYRILAKRYHPDKNKNPDAPEKFKKIVIAYNYMLEHQGETPTAPPAKEDSKPVIRGSDLKVILPVTLEEVIQCKKKRLKTQRLGHCKVCNGTGSQKKETVKCIHCAGTGLQGIYLAMGQKKRCLKCGGEGTLPPPPLCEKCKGKGVVVEPICREIDLNPLAKAIIVDGFGNCCRGGVSGNLVIALDIEKHPIYSLTGLDISGTVFISPAQAVLGDTVQLNALGKDLSLKIPSGVYHNQQIDYDGGGLSYKGKTGKFRCKINISIPKIVTKEEETLYKQLIQIEKDSSWLKTLTM